MPVANIIAIHDEVRNCGFSSSLPSGMRPKRLTTTMTTKIVKKAAAMTNSHPNRFMVSASRTSATAPRPAGEMKPQTTKATARTAAMPNTQRSRPMRLK